MSVKVVNSGSGVINITAQTVPTIKVSSPTVSVVDINPVVTGSTIGPTGAQGPAGSDGQGLEAGGDKHQVLKKTDDVDYNTEWGFADRVFISVKFDEAVSSGDPVYVSGYQSGEDVVKVSKADSSDSAKMPAIGLATEDYALNAFGSVACIGSLYGIDTDDFDVGDVLYVKSGGGLTKDKPTGATNLIQNVGKVGRSQQNTGEIVVMAIGRSNDVPNIADGKIWIGNGSGVATPTTLNAAAIPDFDTEVSNNSSVAANTAKETNVTTNLSVTRDATSVTVVSSDGSDAVLPQSSTTQAGVMSAASHQKLANLNASADVTNSSSVAAAGAIMDTDFTSNGLMERTGSGSYNVVAKNTDNISEGSNNLYYTDARADARVSAVIDTDNTLGSPSDTLVPSQAAIKTYVDNQLGTQNLSLGTKTGTTVAIDISGGGSSVTIPASTTSEAGLMTEAQFDKLAGIEANATADQTAAEIRTLVGAASDSNVFTDADHSKLDAIEASADVTDATNVAAAGALMTTGGQMTGSITFSGSQTVDNRDLSVDGAKLDTIEPNATADQTAAEIRTLVEAATDSNVFTDDDHDKLNAIEANADVTDSNNVVDALVSATSISGGNQTSIKSNLGITDPAATNNLSDVSTGGSANGQLLIYDAVTNTYDPATLTEGSNITITEGAGSITIASTASGGASALDDLSDVTIASAGANQYLVHNGGSTFVNQALDISHDTDPDLGGDLDVGDHSIVTSSGDKDITLTPHGEGYVNLGTYPIKANDSLVTGDNGKVLMYVHADSEIRLQLPPQGTVTTTGSPSNNEIATFTANSDELDGAASFTFDGSNFSTPNVLVEEGTLAAPGRYGSGSRVTRTMFTSADSDKTAGDVYVMRSTDSVWTAKADADAESTASGLLAVAGSTQSASGMVLSGIVRVADNSGFSSASSGAILYLDTTDGHVTATKPTGTGKVVRIVGYVVDPGGAGGATNDGVIYFDPSKDYITLS